MNYGKGAAFENAVRRDFEAHGWHAVRAAGSHTPADVYCIKANAVAYVQCKTNGSLGVAEWNGFIDYCEQVGALPIMAEKVRGGILYHRLTGRKDGSRKKQPMEVWSHGQR